MCNLCARYCRYGQVGSHTGWHRTHLGVTKAVDPAVRTGHQVTAIVGGEG